jgi:glucosamine kinase
MKKIITHYFCIDGGETKSIAILYNHMGKILSKSKSDSGNSFNDVYNVEKNINLLWSDCCKKANLNKNKIKFSTIASFGLAGIRLTKSRVYLEKKINFFKKLILSTDGYIALAGTSLTQSVGVLNIGTGVVSHIILNNFYSQQISGWGFPYGDKGGGWWIGYRIIQETLKAKDGYVMHDVLTKKVLNVIGKKDLEILDHISKLKPNKLAQLSNLLFSTINKSNMSKNIIVEGSEEINEILKYLIEEKKISTIFLVGGISKFYLPYIKKKYLKYIHSNLLNPIKGALLIAMSKFPSEKLINK